MSFLVDTVELKAGLVIFHRADVQHQNWYCRVRVPRTDKYKTISLKTADINDAKEKAFDHDADIRFRVKHDVPVFDKSFEEVAKEYGELQKSFAGAGQITMRRWKVVDGHIRLHLVPYIGNLQVMHVGEDKWLGYPLWRKQNGRSLDGKVKDGTVRTEMVTFRAIMRYAAAKGYIRERQVPKQMLLTDRGRREEFTPPEYRHLHTTARKWITEGKNELFTWYRTMAYNYMLIMANTGMRTMEARNLRWRDVDNRIDRHGRPFVAMNVRGKGKYRELVAANNVATYIERIRAISKATKPDDHVFTTYEGKRSSSLYDTLIADLLTVSELLYSSSGSRRSPYCFRHTYATFRLMEGIDVYFLAKQMGTSVKMIENYYGHITPAKNAERILQGIPGWEPMDEAPGGKTGGVNAAPAERKAKPRTKKDKGGVKERPRR
jgi:integrase